MRVSEKEPHKLFKSEKLSNKSEKFDESALRV